MMKMDLSDDGRNGGRLEGKREPVRFHSKSTPLGRNRT
jgi:hypothetical protein